MEQDKGVIQRPPRSMVDGKSIMMKIELENYAVVIHPNFDDHPDWHSVFERKKYSSIFVLTDNNTVELCYPKLNEFLPPHHLLTINQGESEKNIETCKFLWNLLIEKNADRNSLLINLGGGVIGDMGAFVASTFKRGFDFINIPTTLLSQVDASVGGKAGIDYNGIKNLIGVFNDPKAVFIFPDFLKTLPAIQLKSGYAEVLKHGIISDKTYWELTRSINLNDLVEWDKIIERSVIIKKTVVEYDPYEAGLRKILNFGHTIGHAVETWSLINENQPLLHGEAVAIGMICEAWLSSQINQLETNDLNEIINTIFRYFEKHEIPENNFDEILKFMRSDKKNTDDAILFSLINRIGSCDFNLQAPESLIKESLQFYCGL